MKVYLVKQRCMDCDSDEVYVIAIFDSEEKAKQYIETTYTAYTYDEEEEVWVYEDTYDTTEVWFEEWEVQ